MWEDIVVSDLLVILPAWPIISGALLPVLGLQAVWNEGFRRRPFGKSYAVRAPEGWVFALAIGPLILLHFQLGQTLLIESLTFASCLGAIQVAADLSFAIPVGTATTVLVGLVTTPNESVAYLLAQGVALAVVRACPRAFTVAEAASWATASGLWAVASATEARLAAPEAFCVHLAGAAFLGVALTAMLQRGGAGPMSSWYALFCVAAGFLVVALRPREDGTLLLWFLSFVFLDLKHIAWIGYWILSCGASLYAIQTLARHWNVVEEEGSVDKDVRRKRIIIRKAYHLLACILFIPPLIRLDDRSLTFVSLALLVASVIMIFLEAARYTNAPLVKKPLTEFIGRFVDEREKDGLVLTHLYLLLGCAIPIWLEAVADQRDRDPLHAFSGVLLVGIGDAAAAVFGVSYGKFRWPGSHRTLEGWIAMVLGVVAGAAGLGLWPPAGSRCAFLLSLLAAAFLEVFTVSFDNLVVPLFFSACYKGLVAADSLTLTVAAGIILFVALRSSWGLNPLAERFA
jgi:dolichol kinase